MFTKIYPNFHTVWVKLLQALHDYGKVEKTANWQGKQTQEGQEFLVIRNLSFQVPIDYTHDQARNDIRPDMVWVEKHFAERVGGNPLNPGESYKLWGPYRNNPANDIHRIQEKFDHTYMERIWPKYAGGPWEKIQHNFITALLQDDAHRGIRFAYGDLDDLVTLLLRDPTTRQAYLPIFFPEDTGCNHMGRVPCSLGYHFEIVGDRLNVNYTLRACDLIRHYRDDMYLAYRLADWVMEQLIHRSAEFDKVVMPRLGYLNVSIYNLHAFAKEKGLIQKMYATEAGAA